MNNIKYVILWNYIIIKNKFTEIFDNFFQVFTNTYSIYSLKKHNGNVNVNEQLRYYVIILLNMFVKKLETIIKFIDVKTDVIEITKKTDAGICTILLDRNRYGRCVTISDIIQHVNESNLLNEYEIPYLITKCTLINNNFNVCLKKYLIKYIDTIKQHDNTLENIILMNDVPTIKDSLIHLTLFNKGIFYNYVLNYNDIKTMHINFFYSLI